MTCLTCVVPQHQGFRVRHIICLEVDGVFVNVNVQVHVCVLCAGEYACVHACRWTYIRECQCVVLSVGRQKKRFGSVMLAIVLVSC